ncbi:metallophosphoesterase [Klebsiella aerogenes]
MTTHYQRIDGADWRNIRVVGDLHGSYTLLLQKLDEIGFNTTQDLLLLVGDLIERVEEDVEYLTLLTQPWFRAVCGNHEQFLLDHLQSGFIDFLPAKWRKAQFYTVCNLERELLKSSGPFNRQVQSPSSWWVTEQQSD